MTPLVSIIMPTFNGARFIRQAVESVLNQSYAQHELIVVDDGSTDDTRQVLEPVMRRLRYVELDHAGSSAARNAGLGHATGDFIAFLDSDDLLPGHALEDRLAQFARAPSAAVVCSGWQVVDLEGRPIVAVKPWEGGARLDLVSLLLHKQVLNGTITIRRDCIDQVGGFDATLKHAQDIDLVFRIALAGYKLVWLREISCLYRRRSDSASHQGPIQAEMMDRVLDKIFRSPLLPDQARLREPEVRYYTHLWYAWHLAQLGFPLEMRERLKQALNSAADPAPEIAYQWMRIFSRWSHAFAYPALADEDCYRAFRDALPGQAEEEKRIPDALEFWWLVWRAYLLGDATAAEEGLAAYGAAQRQEIVRWIQALVLGSREGVGVEVISRFWRDARLGGLVPQANRHEVATLYLSALTNHLLARRWGRALRSLRSAALAGMHPGGLAAWFRYAQMALARAFRLRIWRRPQPA